VRKRTETLVRMSATFLPLDADQVPNTASPNCAAAYRAEIRSSS
jgi:hypothetical protein